MWALVVPYLAKFGISLAITLLEKSGLLTAVEAAAVRAGTHIIQATEAAPDYNIQKNAGSSTGKH